MKEEQQKLLSYPDALGQESECTLCAKLQAQEELLMIGQSAEHPMLSIVQHRFPLLAEVEKGRQILTQRQIEEAAKQTTSDGRCDIDKTADRTSDHALSLSQQREFVEGDAHPNSEKHGHGSRIAELEEELRQVWR